MDDYDVEEVTSSSSSSSSSSPQPLDQMAVDEYRAQNHLPMTPDFFELTCDNSKDFGLQAAGSMSREWTNEKHSLFLDSMEASFVRRLHNHEYDSMDTLGQHSRMENLHDLKPPNQFKMLQSGCWKKTNFEFSKPKTNTVDENRALLDNQWIRHFRYVVKHQEFVLPNQHENGARSGESIYSGGKNVESIGGASCGATLHSKKLQVGYSHQRDQDYFIDNSEGSDQNFVGEDSEQTHTRNHHKGKKMKKTTADVHIRDQVVPLNQHATTGDLNESQAHPRKDYINLDKHQIESITDSACAQ